MSRLCANKEKLKEIWQRKEKRRELGAKMSGGRSTWLHLAAPGCTCKTCKTCEFRGRSCKMGGGADTLRRRAVKNREVLLNLETNFVKKIV